MKKRVLRKIRRALKRIIIIIFFIITIASAYSLSFSEIMYNPQGSDTGREWIELSNPECEDLEEYGIFENNINHRITMYSDGTCDYPIICDDCVLLLNEYNVSSRIYESSFTLGNTGEYLGLRLNGTIVDSINYTGMENIEGMSITRYDGWINTLPTPGYFVLQNNSMNGSINNLTNTTLNMTINETINMTINITTNETINITANITLNNITNENMCNITLGIRIKEDKPIYYNKESIKFYNTLNVSPGHKIEYTIEYWVEDIYGNILKSNVQTSNLNEKSYTPSVDEKTVAIAIKNQLINITCNNSMQTNIINGTAEKIIIVKNLDYKEKECDECDKCEKSESENGLEEESRLGVELNEDVLEIDAYRGNDRKYVVSAEMKNENNRKVADLLKISLEKYSGAIIELPLQKEECGQFSINTEGLGIVDSKTYSIECDEDILKEENRSVRSIVQKASGNNDASRAENLTKNVSQFFHEPLITGQIVYESKNEKTKEYSLIGILILLTGTGIYSLYRMILSKKQT